MIHEKDLFIMEVLFEVFFEFLGIESFVDLVHYHAFEDAYEIFFGNGGS